MSEVRHIGEEVIDPNGFESFGNFQDEEAKKKWFQHHYQTLLNRIKRFYFSAYRSSLTESEIDDLSQDTVARIYERANSFERNSKVFTWAVKIAERTAIDFFRKRKKNPDLSPNATLDDFSGSSAYPGHSTLTSHPPALMYESHESQVIGKVDLAKAMKGLDEKQRMIITLRFVEGYEPNDIAKKLGLNPETVRSHLFRLSNILARKLGGGFQQRLSVRMQEMRKEDQLRALTEHDLINLRPALTEEEFNMLNFRLQGMPVKKIAMQIGKSYNLTLKILGRAKKIVEQYLKTKSK